MSLVRQDRMSNTTHPNPTVTEPTEHGDPISKALPASILVEAVYAAADLAQWRASRPETQSEAQNLALFLERAISRYRRTRDPAGAIEIFAGALALLQSIERTPQSRGDNVAM
jgi:hypothetical protein